MLQTLQKVDDRRRAERLLAAQEKAVRTAYLQFVASADKIDLADVGARGGVEAILRRLDAHINQLGNALSAAFVDVAASEAAQLGRKLTFKAAAIVTINFNPGDRRAAELMEANRLAFVRNLTQQQREATRQALVTGMQRGLGTREMAALFRNSIGLTYQQQQSLEAFERALVAGRQAELDLPPDQRGPVNSARDIERMIADQQQRLLAARSEAIARTESLRIVTQARSEATRQSMRATGQRADLSGKEWASSHDARTRQAHQDRDGARRRLNEAFAPGIQQPGDGGPAEAINCRCTLLYEFFDTEAELAAWLQGGT